MGEHKITIEIISNPENNVLQTQNYTLQKYGQYSRILHNTSKLTINTARTCRYRKKYKYNNPDIYPATHVPQRAATEPESARCW